MKTMIKRCKYLILYFCLSGICQAQQTVSAPPERATDFTYTLATDRQGTLYAIHSEWILLYFYDPTCEDCHALMERLNASEVINRLIEEKRLQVLAVYPEEDTEAWLEQAKHVPPAWVNGYDKGAVINTKGLYLIKTLPALYLLDRDKNIRLKEATAEEVENELKPICN
ncbi:MAG: thioredoxin family protein [Tannerella sp.]|nr:thioredoxin family protein [Tannerella sp.]